MSDDDSLEWEVVHQPEETSFYLEILALYPKGKKARGFVGPFKSDGIRIAYRDYYDGMFKKFGGGCNVKFFSRDALPEGMGAILPDKFTGLRHLPLEE